MKTVLRGTWLAWSAVLLTAVLAGAQTTITASDLLGLIGKSQTIESDTTGSLIINLGAAGANQTWDFRAVTLQADRAINQFLSPQTTPFAGRYPLANLVQKTTFPAEPGVEYYLYLQVTTTNVRSLGAGFITPDTAIADFEGGSDFAPLPLQFGATWNTARADTIGDLATFGTVIRSTASNTVDAWGRVRLPIGDFDCLRVRANSQTISLTYIGGTLFLADTTIHIDYSWISRDNFFVAQASSQDGETNPNFTKASSFSRLASLTTAVAENTGNSNPPAGFALAQNFPNPFNPETTISFRIARPAFTELVIYNLTGEKIRTLVSAALSAGTHAVRWDGRDDRGRRAASGVYIYRLKAGEVVTARTMLLLP
ncbi:MAG: T9SS type A sorting domain-containing protein [candidate division KSB1 bacterium]|nr:T9SS type A sorting domain-containing protein [candidate division KSB1 bacterium]MDZ7275082.1 T9SS type A sorting domain-containing protein [candidate division KSB1 bacterium]MDZ7286470.1 T9SS type A sorting domain-containing protein [candidate division KSB1 bacterium]MDZ7299366.1 T9SS type A sorting domain-containing protein [candidate division KSB1 bacterium]MDZ7306305.1 T9SS type A sorting domain-containing protein [candidate division KSB1 bacterium]